MGVLFTTLDIQHLCSFSIIELVLFNIVLCLYETLLICPRISFVDVTYSLYKLISSFPYSIYFNAIKINNQRFISFSYFP